MPDKAELTPQPGRLFKGVGLRIIYAEKNFFLNRKELFERWTAAYPEALKPKLLLGRFRGVTILVARGSAGRCSCPMV